MMTSFSFGDKGLGTKKRGKPVRPGASQGVVDMTTMRLDGGVSASGDGGWAGGWREDGAGDGDRKVGTLARHIRPSSNPANTSQETVTLTADLVDSMTRACMVRRKLVTLVVPFSSSVPRSV